MNNINRNDKLKSSINAAVKDETVTDRKPKLVRLAEAIAGVFSMMRAAA